MAQCRTDCIEKPLCTAFRKLGSCVGKKPWWFLLIPLLVSGGLGTGFCFFIQNENNNIEDQFTPIKGPAKLEREFIKKHFPAKDSQSFSRQRLYTEGTFASFIAISKDDNILTKAAFEEILSLDIKVKDFQFADNGRTYSYSNLCAKVGDTCVSNAVLDLVNYDPGLVERKKMYYPKTNHNFIGIEVGGIELDEFGAFLKKAKAIRLRYPLKANDEKDKRLSLLWIQEFLHEFPKAHAHLTHIEVSHFTSVSRQEEFEKNSKRIIPLFSVTYLLAISFSVLSCMRIDSVRNKFWVAILGVISAGLAVLTGFGLLLYCGTTFAINTASAPFLILGEDFEAYRVSNEKRMITNLIANTKTVAAKYVNMLEELKEVLNIDNDGPIVHSLSDGAIAEMVLDPDKHEESGDEDKDIVHTGIGIDDMFIMLASWQKTKVHDKVEERLAETYAEAAVSITITTLTDILAFYIGIMTPFRSVQSFCVYTGTTVLFCFIYNITFFGAVLALNGRREASNRHWLTFRKVETDSKPGQSTFSAMCCVGGAYDAESGVESEHAAYFFFKEHYGPFLTNGWTKAGVVLLYLGYFAASIYGCLQLKEGIDLRNLSFDDSYVIKFYDSESDFFSVYGPRVMVTVTEPVDYWNSTIQDEIEVCMDRLENNTYVNRELSESWLRAHIDFSKKMHIDIKDKNTFIGNLPKFFKSVPAFQEDVEISQDEMSIRTSRFFIQIVNASDSLDQKNMLIELRSLVKECRIPLLVYHPAFIYFDQFLVIVANTIQNVIMATFAMLVISLLLIPNPICSLWVTFAIISVLVGVAGFMAFWNVNLDSISMIDLIICIGFSVDFTAHISYAFVANDKTNANERAIDVLHTLGYPVIQGAISTILGVVVLSTAASYIFRTFFKIMFLVIFFGALHGIVFMPVFLTFYHICGNQNNDTSSEVKDREERSQRRNPNAYQGVYHCEVNVGNSSEVIEIS